MQEVLYLHSDLPHAHIYKKGQGINPRIAEGEHLEFCILCGHCAAICPTGAITHDFFPPGSIVPVKEEALPSADQAIEMLRMRRSVREFKKKPVER